MFELSKSEAKRHRITLIGRLLDAAELLEDKKESKAANAVREAVEIFLKDFEAEPCTTCSGSGTISESYVHPSNPNLDDWIRSVCWNCKGKGVV